jgi:hypothetical protein
MLDVRYDLLVELGGLRNESDGAASVVTFCGREDALARVHSFVRSFVPKVIQSQVRPVPVQIREGFGAVAVHGGCGRGEPNAAFHALLPAGCVDSATGFASGHSSAGFDRMRAYNTRVRRFCARQSAVTLPEVRWVRRAAGRRGPSAAHRRVPIRHGTQPAIRAHRSARTYPMLSYPSVHAVSDAASRWLANPAPL